MGLILPTNPDRSHPQTREKLNEDILNENRRAPPFCLRHFCGGLRGTKWKLLCQQHFDGNVRQLRRESKSRTKLYGQRNKPPHRRLSEQNRPNAPRANKPRNGRGERFSRTARTFIRRAGSDWCSRCCPRRQLGQRKRSGWDWRFIRAEIRVQNRRSAHPDQAQPRRLGERASEAGASGRPVCNRTGLRRHGGVSTTPRERAGQLTARRAPLSIVLNKSEAPLWRRFLRSNPAKDSLSTNPKVSQ